MTILLPFLLSIDSLLASLALCIARVEPRRQIKLAIAFGACDGAASLIRCLFNVTAGNVPLVNSHWFQLGMGLYLLAVYLVCLFKAAIAFRSPFMWTVPLVLSIDNLAGPQISPVSAGSVALVALASASMSLVGFRLGTFLAHMVSRLAPNRAFFRRLPT